MKAYWNHPVKLIALLLLTGFVTTGSTCSTSEIIGSTVGSTVGFGRTPSNDLEQVYYLGVFDPKEQIPSTIYRVIVRGQASAISQMDFGSGWVPAEMLESGLRKTIEWYLENRTWCERVKSGAYAGERRGLGR